VATGHKQSQHPAHSTSRAAGVRETKFVAHSKGGNSFRASRSCERTLRCTEGLEISLSSLSLVIGTSFIISQSCTVRPILCFAVSSFISPSPPSVLPLTVSLPILGCEGSLRSSPLLSLYLSFVYKEIQKTLLVGRFHEELGRCYSLGSVGLAFIVPLGIVACFPRFPAPLREEGTSGAKKGRKARKKQLCACCPHHIAAPSKNSIKKASSFFFSSTRIHTRTPPPPSIGQSCTEPNETGRRQRRTKKATIMMQAAASGASASSSSSSRRTTAAVAAAAEAEPWRSYGQERRRWLLEQDAARMNIRMNAACCIHKYFALADRVRGSFLFVLMLFKPCLGASWSWRAHERVEPKAQQESFRERGGKVGSDSSSGINILIPL
jgi:hypothetical protein